MSLLAIAFPLFLLMDPIGNIPFYISFLKGINPKRQRYIIFRELTIALFIIFLFNFLGNGLMDFLNIQHDTLQIGGGIVLFLLCLKMIFPQQQHSSSKELSHGVEPFIVPLAVPLIAGPSVLAAVMIYSKQAQSNLIMLGAILLAWLSSFCILILSSFLRDLLTWKGILALERLMGLILILISIQMFLSGLSIFIHKQGI